MRVSIITVVFNGASTIRDCIKSVVEQSYPDIEYIIVDGGSTDGTVEIVKEFGSKIAVFTSESDRGIYDAMNKGINMATGDVVGILNADDFYRDNLVIGKVVDQLKVSNADGLYADLIYVDATNPSTVKRYWKSGNYHREKFLYGWMPPHPTFFLTKASYIAFGTYRLDLGSAADYELMLRMAFKHVLTITYLPQVITVMREGGVSNRSITNRMKANQNDRKAWVINDIRPLLFTLWLKPIRKISQFFNLPKVTVK
jgi:glycosyltransferase involved in cell wall biosynthesis